MADGILDILEDDDSLSGLSAIVIEGSVFKNESSIGGGSDTLIAFGTIPNSGSLEFTESSDTLDAVGVSEKLAELGGTESDDTLESIASLSIAATFSVSEDDDDFTSSESGGLPDQIHGQIFYPEPSDTLIGQGLLKIFASLSTEEDSDFIFTGGFIGAQPCCEANQFAEITCPVLDDIIPGLSCIKSKHLAFTSEWDVLDYCDTSPYLATERWYIPPETTGINCT